MRTSDFVPFRSVVGPTKAANDYPISAFYGGPNGALHAVFRTNDGIALVRVVEPTEPAPPPAYLGPGDDFAASADGRVGLVLRDAVRDEDARTVSAVVDVVDLATFARKSTVTLSGDVARGFVDLAPNADGSELYLLGDVTRFRSIDTATGAVVRDVPTGWTGDADTSLRNLCSGGRALAIAAIGNPCGGVWPEGAFWVEGGRKGPLLLDASAPLLAASTARVRYGLRMPGYAIYRSVAGGRPVRVGAFRGVKSRSGEIEDRSESLQVSPDGRFVILFESYSEPFCPC
jgi:hypothetical protein